jgi:hypothetical protein
LLRGLPARRCRTPRAAFRLGDLVEALDRELPAVADLADGRSTLEADQDIIT